MWIVRWQRNRVSFLWFYDVTKIHGVYFSLCPVCDRASADFCSAVAFRRFWFYCVSCCTAPLCRVFRASQKHHVIRRVVLFHVYRASHNHHDAIRCVVRRRSVSATYVTLGSIPYLLSIARPPGYAHRGALDVVVNPSSWESVRGRQQRNG